MARSSRSSSWPEGRLWRLWWRLVEVGGGLQSPCPIRDRSCELAHHAGVRPARPLEHVKRVIATLHKMQGGALAQPFHHRAQQRQVGELVTISLQEEHRDLHSLEMLRPFVARLPGRMQRKAEE